MTAWPSPSPRRTPGQAGAGHEQLLNQHYNYQRETIEPFTTTFSLPGVAVSGKIRTEEEDLLVLFAGYTLSDQNIVVGTFCHPADREVIARLFQQLIRSLGPIGASPTAAPSPPPITVERGLLPDLFCGRRLVEHRAYQRHCSRSNPVSLPNNPSPRCCQYLTLSIRPFNSSLSKYLRLQQTRSPGPLSPLSPTRRHLTNGFGTRLLKGLHCRCLRLGRQPQTAASFMLTTLTELKVLWFVLCLACPRLATLLSVARMTLM